MLEHGADVNKVDGFNEWSPLNWAMKQPGQKRYELARYLIEQGADIYYYTDWAVPIFDSVVIHSDDSQKTIDQGYDLFCYLIEKNVTIECKYYPRTLICHAANFNNIAVIQYLIENGYSDVDELTTRKETALIVAARWGNKEACQMLLNYGADITKEDEEGKTAYDYAVEEGYSDIVQLLNEK